MITDVDTFVIRIWTSARSQSQHPSGTGTSSSSFTIIVNTPPTATGGYKQKGLEKVDLSWSGRGGTSFDVYRSGVTIATGAATAYTDNVGRKASGPYAYKVCAASGSVCSSVAMVSF